MRTTTRYATFVGLLLLALAAGTVSIATGHAQTAPGAFAASPVFDARGTAFAVFGGGSAGQLEAAAQGAGATGVWAQDASGAYQLLVVNGPAFLKAPFTAAFPAGFAGATAVTLVRPAGGASPPPVPASTPAPAATPPPAPSTFDATVAQLTLQRTNEQRIANGQGALAANSLLNASAAAYAQVIFQRDPYLANLAAAHSLDGEPWDRATRAGYQWAAFAENVATASSSATPLASAVAQLTVDGWMNSPPHRQNILTAGYADTGVGCVSGRPAAPRPGLEFATVCVAVYGTPK